MLSTSLCSSLSARGAGSASGSSGAGAGASTGSSAGPESAGGRDSGSGAALGADAASPRPGTAVATIRLLLTGVVRRAAPAAATVTSATRTARGFRCAPSPGLGGVDARGRDCGAPNIAPPRAPRQRRHGCTSARLPSLIGSGSVPEPPLLAGGRLAAAGGHRKLRLRAGRYSRTGAPLHSSQLRQHTLLLQEWRWRLTSLAHLRTRY